MNPRGGRWLVAGLMLLIGAGLGAAAFALFLRWREAGRVDAPMVVERLKEVARLESLEVRLYKKISFEPEPETKDTLWGAVAQWARYQTLPPKARAIVFAKAHLTFDLEKLDARALTLDGPRASLALPPVQVRVELLPGETEVLGSNLDSAQTAQLLEHARLAFERDVLSDEELKERARSSARNALARVLMTLGYSDVRFIPVAPAL